MGNKESAVKFDDSYINCRHITAFYHTDRYTSEYPYYIRVNVMDISTPIDVKYLKKDENKFKGDLNNFKKCMRIFE